MLLCPRCKRMMHEQFKNDDMTQWRCGGCMWTTTTYRRPRKPRKDGPPNDPK